MEKSKENSLIDEALDNLPDPEEEDGFEIKKVDVSQSKVDMPVEINWTMFEKQS